MSPKFTTGGTPVVLAEKTSNKIAGIEDDIKIQKEFSKNLNEARAAVASIAEYGPEAHSAVLGILKELQEKSSDILELKYQQLVCYRYRLVCYYAKL